MGGMPQQGGMGGMPQQGMSGGLASLAQQPSNTFGFK